jgi:Xaa-Pro aminopeptidase
MINRLKQLKAIMQDNELESFFVTDPLTIRYLANFTGTTALLFFTLTEQFLITDSRYAEQANNQSLNFEIIKIRSSNLWFEDISKIIKSKNIKNVGFETTMTYLQYLQLKENLPANVRTIATTKLVEKIREIKDEAEIAIITQACKIADAAFDYILGEIKPGVEEIEIANKLEFFMRNLGATGLAFNTVVASGVRSSMPHGVASKKKIAQGDIVTLDYGCRYKGYVSDMTRTIALGKPDNTLKKIYNIVLEAQKRAIDIAKPGTLTLEYDKAARSYITQKGYGKNFSHGIGHGIGLEVHEGPYILKKRKKYLQKNHVITAEPGIYLPGIGGVRIEDDLLITADGHRLLTKSPKELIIL